jgi:hypothetical protein
VIFIFVQPFPTWPARRLGDSLARLGRWSVVLVPSLTKAIQQMPPQVLFTPMCARFPDDTAPRWLLRDRDAIYGDVFRRRVAGMGIMEVITSPSSPWQNPYAERLIGSLRRECLDHVIILSQRIYGACSLGMLLTTWVENASLTREGRTHATTRAELRGGTRDRMSRGRRTAPSFRTTRRLHGVVEFMVWPITRRGFVGKGIPTGASAFDSSHRPRLVISSGGLDRDRGPRRTSFGEGHH